jgi:hypothetical protein
MQSSGAAALVVIDKGSTDPARVLEYRSVEAVSAVIFLLQ